MEQSPYSLDYLRQVLAAYFADKPVWRVQVFGSYARGEATAASDLDLLLELAHPVGWEYFHYAPQLADLLGIRVDLGTSVSDYIIRCIKRELQTLYESEKTQAA